MNVHRSLRPTIRVAADANARVGAMRRGLIIVHRWAGLTIVFALVVTGLTGAILPYHRELSQWIAADVWHAAPPQAGAPMLSGVELARRVEAQTGGVVSYISLNLSPDRTQSVFVSQREGGEALPYQQVFADPYTGALRAKVRYGDLRDGAINVMPFLISFHYSLAAGAWGRWIMGVAALIWCAMCVTGFVLSWPAGLAGRLGDRLRRWWPAWRVRRGQGTHAFAHDLHRASGLWLWPIMLVFAWSAVAFNLDPVHDRVQGLFGAKGLYRPVVNEQPDAGAAMAPEQALAVGERLMAREAAQRGFSVQGGEAISFNPYAQAIGYYARTSLDAAGQGATVVWFDQASGRLLAFRSPYGATRADAVDKTVRMLHTASYFGWPFRVFVSAFGLMTAVMAIAGFTLWARRSARRLKRVAPAYTS
jgi:uncharacterized iron-regulated membrane protein